MTVGAIVGVAGRGDGQISGLNAGEGVALRPRIPSAGTVDIARTCFWARAGSAPRRRWNQTGGSITRSASGTLGERGSFLSARGWITCSPRHPCKSTRFHFAIGEFVGWTSFSPVQRCHQCSDGTFTLGTHG